LSKNGFSIIIGRLEESRNRLRHLSEENNMRDIDEIWEAYCDVEEGIALSNFVLEAFDHAGKFRRLSVALKDDPDRIGNEDLRKKFSLIDANLTASLEKFSKGSGEDGAEFARRARDALKKMLIAHSKSDKKKTQSA
jgi:hypothetical protein